MAATEVTNTTKAASSVSTVPRLEGLDGLRALAALAVLVTHVGFFTLYNVSGTFGAIVGRLTMAIPLFFMISGLVLNIPFVRADFGTGPGVDLRRYAKRRALRILPIYWIALIVSQLIATNPLSAGEMASAALTLNLFWPAKLIPLLEQSWTISVEVAFYLVLPLLARLARSAPDATLNERLRRQLGVAVAMVAVAYGYRVTVGFAGFEDSVPVFNLLPNFLDQFAVGMGAAALIEYRRIRSIEARPLGQAAAIGLWGAAAGVLALSAYGAGLPTDTIRLSASEHIVEHFLFTVGAALVLGAVVWGPRSGLSPTGLLSTRPLRWFGAIAYSFYLAQNLVFDRLMSLYPSEFRSAPDGWFTGPVIPLMLWSLVISLAVGIAGFVWVERPSMRLAGSRETGGLPSAANLHLAGIAAGGLVLRFVTLFNVSSVIPTAGDPFYYHTQANMLADGLGFGEPFRYTQLGLLVPAAIHPPGYSSYLGLFSALGARTILDHKMASILLGTLSIVVVGLIARRLGGDKAALLAAVGVAVYPNFWLPDGILMPEGMFILACALVIYLAYKWRDKPSSGVAAGIGLLIGVAAMARGEGLLLFVVLVVPWMWLQRSMEWRRRLGHIVLVGLCTTFAIAPWMVRNLATYEEFVPLSTNGDEVIFYANCPDSYSGDYVGYWVYACQERVRQRDGEFPGDESQRAKAWRNLGLEYMSDHRSEVPKVLAIRVGRVWELYRPAQNARLSTIEGRDLRSQQAALIGYFAMTPFVLAGWWMARRRNVPTWPLVAQAVCVTLTTLYAYGADRFRAPAEITWVVLASLGAVWLWERYRGTEIAPRRPNSSSGDRLR